jgi:site-specific recombinase XerD
MAKRAKRPKSVLKLPDLDYSKSTVLNSLPSLNSRRSYEYAIRDFIEWYCSEPRLAFNKTVVTRYRIALEQRSYAPSTINLRLAAVRRLAYEASDCGLLSPDLAAGIRRVKGAKRLGVRVGNWLTAEQGNKLLAVHSGKQLRELRNHAVLAMLLGCGLRRAELVAVKIDDFELREEHWVLTDLVGKGRHIRTIPVPGWVKSAVDAWTGAVQGHGFTAKVIWSIVREAAMSCGIGIIAPHDLRRTCARLCHQAGGELEQIQFLLGHVFIQTTERYLGCKQRIQNAVNDRIGIAS